MKKRLPLVFQFPTQRLASGFPRPVFVGPQLWKD